MTQSELAKLEEQALRDIKKDLAKRKENYRYARSLGFGYAEARRLSGASKEKIKRLAEMRGPATKESRIPGFLARFSH